MGAGATAGLQHVAIFWFHEQCFTTSLRFLYLFHLADLIERHKSVMWRIGSHKEQCLLLDIGRSPISGIASRRNDISMVGAHELALLDSCCLLLQHLVQRPVTCAAMPCQGITRLTAGSRQPYIPLRRGQSLNAQAS